jgi:hypothetical protein
MFFTGYRASLTTTTIGTVPTSVSVSKSLTGSYGTVLDSELLIAWPEGTISSVYPSRRRLRDEVGADDAVGARLVVDDHRLADLLGQLVRDDAADLVRRAACRESRGSP